MEERTRRVLEFEKIREKLVGHTMFSLGREYAEKLMPSNHYDEVKQMLYETDCAEGCLLKRGNPPLGGSNDIIASIKRMDVGGMLNPVELMRVRGVLTASRQMKKYFQEGKREDTDTSGEADNHEEQDVIGGLISGLTANRKLEDSIDMAILGEEEISDSASPALRAIRKKIRDTQESIKTKISDFIRSPKYSKFIQDDIVTVRGDRYVIPVKQEYKSEIKGLVHDSSASGQTLFIEPMVVVEANNRIKELKVKEQIEIERILAELTAMCCEFSTELFQNVKMLARLDFAFAKGKLSLEYKCVTPKLNDKGIIKIIKGRHPLLDAKEVVPIDFWVGGDIHSVIVTGPNTGGKTVTLKTIGLFTLMAQSGLNVPAAFGTELSVFRQIFADIGDEQSIEQSLSTFSSHMKNIVGILDHTDDSSLVLFDELGAGTDPTEGAALAMSILECVYQKGAITLATTHYSELKAYALTTDGVENASCEFDVETLKPTYKLLIGVPGKSNAFAISQRLGLDINVIERAKAFLTAEDVKFEDMMINLEKNKAKAEQERLEAETIKRDLEIMKKELEDKRFAIKEHREKLLREANEKAYEVLENAKKESSEILARLKEMETVSALEANKKEAEALRLRLKKKTDDVAGDLAYKVSVKGEGKDSGTESIAVGDMVEIITLHQKGTVVTLPKSNGDLIVQVGNVKVNSHVSNLKRITKTGKEPEKGRRGYASGGLSAQKRQTASLEIDIRGQAIDEAELIIDKFLDDSAMANVEEVRIIHGKGTGALRSGVQSFLRRNKHVRAFRLGTFGEGESGVTVVQLK